MDLVAGIGNLTLGIFGLTLALAFCMLRACLTCCAKLLRAEAGPDRPNPNRIQQGEQQATPAPPTYSLTPSDARSALFRNNTSCRPPAATSTASPASQTTTKPRAKSSSSALSAAPPFPSFLPITKMPLRSWPTPTSGSRTTISTTTKTRDRQAGGVSDLDGAVGARGALSVLPVHPGSDPESGNLLIVQGAHAVHPGGHGALLPVAHRPDPGGGGRAHRADGRLHNLGAGGVRDRECVPGGPAPPGSAGGARGVTSNLIKIKSLGIAYMTEAALQEVRKSRELIANLMAAGKPQSPSRYVLAGSRLRGLCASPLSEGVVLSPSNLRLNVRDIVASPQPTLDGRKHTHKRELSTAAAGTTMATQPSFIADNSSLLDAELALRGRCQKVRPDTPSRNEPPSVSGSFEATVKWAQNRPFSPLSAANQESIIEESTPAEETKQNSHTSLVAFLKDMTSHIQPHPRPHQHHPVTISQQTSTSELDEQGSRCPQHPDQESLYFCEDTNELFCVVCAFEYRQKHPNAGIKDLRLKFHQLRVEITSAQKKEEKAMNALSSVQRKLSANKQAVNKAIYDRYEEILSQLKQECALLESAISQISDENDSALTKKKTANEARVADIKSWLEFAREVETRPERGRFLRLLGQFERLLKPDSKRLQADFHTIQYNPPRGPALQKSSSLGSVVSLKIETRGERNKPTFRKKRGAHNISTSSVGSQSSDMQVSFGGGLGNQHEAVARSLQNAAARQPGAVEEKTPKMAGSKQNRNLSIDSKITKASTAFRAATGVHSRQESLAPKFGRGTPGAGLSLIEELEAKRINRAQKSHVSMAVVKRAISMAKVNTGGDREVNRNGLSESRTANTPSQHLDSQPANTLESTSSDPFLRPASAHPHERVHSQIDFADDQASHQSPSDNFLNLKSSIASSGPKIPLEQIKLSSSSRNASERKQSSSELLTKKAARPNRQFSGVGGFSPGLTTIQSRSGLPVDTLGSPMSSQPAFTDDITPFSEDSRDGSIPIQHMPRMSRDQSYLNLVGDDSDYSLNKHFNYAASEASNITRKNTNYAITPKLTAYGNINDSIKGSGKSLTPREQLSGERKPHKGISGHYGRGDQSFRTKLNQIVEKGQRRHSRHHQLGGLIFSSNSTNRLKQNPSSNNSSIRLIPTSSDRHELSHLPEVPSECSSPERRATPPVHTKSVGALHHPHSHHPHHPSHLVKPDRLTTETEEITKFMGGRTGSRSITPLSHFSASSGMDDRGGTPERKVTDSSLSGGSGGQLLFNTKLLSSKPIDQSRNLPQAIQEHEGSSRQTSTLQSQKPPDTSFEIPEIDLNLRR